MKIKKGDKVKVIAGKDKGKSGVVVRAFPREDKVLIEGIALYKRHLKGREGKVGTVVERPRPIHVSNVARVEKAEIKSALDASVKLAQKAKAK
ncbi:50S ribosomal protein L24 [Candidatus Kaiserbacteria bacterium]|nr:50S ribosomal protein L24 [Candidatus Kaiserbacteria bacterium]